LGGVFGIFSAKSNASRFFHLSFPTRAHGLKYSFQKQLTLGEKFIAKGGCPDFLWGNNVKILHLNIV